jgi:hypothetical protein
MAPRVPEARAAAARSVVFGGLTSQGWPVVAYIARSGKRLELAVIGLDMSCTSGSRFPLDDGVENLRIRANGTVHHFSAVPPTAGSSVSITGGSDSFTGKLNRERLTFTGKWQLHLNFATSNGQTDQCDSGPVTFKTRL